MPRDDLEAHLRGTTVAQGYLEPRYTGYAFAAVPATAAAALGVDLGPTVPPGAIVDPARIERVVALVVDGLGWTHWTREATSHEGFRRLRRRGSVVPLASGYPSETAACMTTFHTLEPPVRHGLIGWSVYVEALEAVVEPLPFRTAAGAPLDDHRHAVSRAELLFEGQPIYPDLRATGVAPVVVMPSELVGSPYSKRVLDGASVVRYGSVADLAEAVRRELETAAPPQYVHAYSPLVDEAAHQAGTASAAWRDALAGVATALEELAGAVSDAVAAETLVLVTADHGAVDTDPPSNVDLLAIDGVRDRLRRTSRGDPIPPSGGPRNVHLHVRPTEVDALRSRLEARLDALVLERGEATAAGLFGDAEPSARFEQRAGDLIVIPKSRSVWYGADPAGLEAVGMHGGLHPDELLVPLASARLDALSR